MPAHATARSKMRKKGFRGERQLIVRDTPRRASAGTRGAVLACALSLCAAAAQAQEQGSISLEAALARILAANPQVDLQKASVEQAQGNVMITEGAFDWSLTAGLANSRSQESSFSSSTGQEVPTQILTDAVSMGTSKTFRNGWSLTVSNEVGRSRLDDARFGTVGTNDLSAKLTVPLLRGAGPGSPQADQNQALATLSSTRLSSVHEITGLIYQGVVGYWNSYALQRNIDVMNETMQRAAEVADMLVARVRGGELAQVEYDRSLAELRLREVDVLDSVQSAVSAREQLAVILGIDEHGAAPEAVTPFPETPAFEKTEALNRAALVATALDRRLDLQALEESARAQSIAVTKSEHNVMPSLDLELSSGYTSGIGRFKSSDVHSLYRGGELNGPDHTAQVTLTYPLGNDAAEGQLRADKASLRQIRANIQTLRNTIRSDVSIAFSRLSTSLRQLRKAEESLRLLEEVAMETRRKLSLGGATMTDLVSVEDRLATSRLQVIEAKRGYATALAELRYVTGTLAAPEGDGVRLDSVVLRTLP